MKNKGIGDKQGTSKSTFGLLTKHFVFNNIDDFWKALAEVELKINFEMNKVMYNSYAPQNNIIYDNTEIKELKSDVYLR